MKGKHLRVGFRVLSTSLGGEQISQRIGLPPTSQSAPGRLETAWVVESPLGIEHPLEDRLAALLDVVEPYAGRFRNLGHGCLMHVVVGSDALACAAGCALLASPLLERLAALPGEGLLIEVPESLRHLPIRELLEA